MPFLDTTRQRAAVLIVLLGVGLAVALAPLASGLVGALVLYVSFAPLNSAMRARGVGARLTAALLTALAVFVIVVPGLSFAGLIVNEARDIAGGVVQSALLRRLAELQVGGFAVGPRLADLGQNVVAWIGSSAFGLIGTATRLAINLTIAFFGLYFLLLKPQETWEFTRPYIPFSTTNAERLRKRFRDVTASTLVGTLLIALVQGGLITVAFLFLGLANALFWGFVTAIFAILPLVGSGLVWGPAAIALVLDGRTPKHGVLQMGGGIISLRRGSRGNGFAVHVFFSIHPDQFEEIGQPERPDEEAEDTEVAHARDGAHQRDDGMNLGPAAVHERTDQIVYGAHH
ncbi:MAG: hypothetical protein A2W29_09110, partial [Gemmatimonadetes bacterium RBG_16_66_8]